MPNKSLDLTLIAQQYALGHTNADLEKQQELFNKIIELKKADTIENARTLLFKNFPQAKEQEQFILFGAQIDVVNTKTMLRICIDTPTEFLSYEYI